MSYSQCPAFSLSSLPLTTPGQSGRQLVDHATSGCMCEGVGSAKGGMEKTARTFPSSEKLSESTILHLLVLLAILYHVPGSSFF